MTVRVRGVSIAPEPTAHDTAPMANSSTSVEIPAELPAPTAISRETADLPDTLVALVGVGETAEKAVTDMSPMSTRTTRLFKRSEPRSV